MLINTLWYLKKQLHRHGDVSEQFRNSDFLIVCSLYLGICNIWYICNRFLLNVTKKYWKNSAKDSACSFGEQKEVLILSRDYILHKHQKWRQSQRISSFLSLPISVKPEYKLQVSSQSSVFISLLSEKLLPDVWVVQSHVDVRGTTR